MKTENAIAVLVALAITGLLAWWLMRPQGADVVSPSKEFSAMHSDSIVFGMGCFWGAEKRMAAIPGVLDVESGYAGGDAPRVGYEDVLAAERMHKLGRGQGRNHAEVIKVTFDPAKVDLATILIAFWGNHDPTQVDGQGNDIGTNYRSAIYFNSEAQKALAEQTRDRYQQALTKAGFGKIATEILPLRNYNRAEDFHQDYLVKNPNGYCGLGGTGVMFDAASDAVQGHAPLDGTQLSRDAQLVVYEAVDCRYCEKFKAEVLNNWKSPVPVATTLSQQAPTGWTLAKPLAATPTMVLFKDGREVSRYTGYNGEAQKFWRWLGFYLLSPEQQRIAFEQGTERPGTGDHLNEHRAGTYFDPITGAALFRSDTKYDSACGWPSFFDPMPGALEMRADNSHGMRRVEVVSASSGIHLGHVFDDGPPPTGKRYCINGNVLKFVPDQR